MINKKLQILFIGMVFFSIGCAKDSGSSKSSASANIPIFPRFSADSLKNATGVTNQPVKVAKASSASQLNNIKKINSTITPLIIKSNDQIVDNGDNHDLLAQCSDNSKTPEGIKDSVGLVSQQTTCLLNGVLDNLDKMFLEDGIVPTIGDATGNFKNMGTYTYTISGNVSKFTLTANAGQTSSVSQMKIVWSKANNQVTINVLVPQDSQDSEDNHELFTMSAYQTENGSVDFLIESKVYDLKTESDIVNPYTFQQRDSLYLAYDATSGTFAFNYYSLAVDASTATADEAASNSQTFHKQNIAATDSTNFSFMVIGNTLDNVALAKFVTYNSKVESAVGDTTDDVTAVFCGNGFTNSDEALTPANCNVTVAGSASKASVATTKIISNATNYNSSKKLTFSYMQKDSTFTANLNSSNSDSLNSTIGHSINIFNQNATTLGSAYSNITAP